MDVSMPRIRVDATSNPGPSSRITMLSRAADKATVTVTVAVVACLVAFTRASLPAPNVASSASWLTTPLPPSWWTFIVRPRVSPSICSQRAMPAEVYVALSGTAGAASHRRTARTSLAQRCLRASTWLECTPFASAYKVLTTVSCRAQLMRLISSRRVLVATIDRCESSRACAAASSYLAARPTAAHTLAKPIALANPAAKIKRIDLHWSPRSFTSAALTSMIAVLSSPEIASPMLDSRRLKLSAIIQADSRAHPMRVDTAGSASVGARFAS